MRHQGNSERDVLAHLADDIDRGIYRLPAGSPRRSWLGRVSHVVRAGAGLRAIRAVSRRDRGEVA
jgi:hypothetical protein